MESLRKAFIAIAAAGAALQFGACGPDRHSYVRNLDHPEVTPTMVTTDVSTFISDSGYTRYHITAPLWQMFEDLPDPYWKFPGGIDLQQFNAAMLPEASMRCDSATYFSQRRLWRLDGHVAMVNAVRDTFLTSQLYWDQNRAEVYSDSFIHIARAQHIIEGYGFRSNQNMTAYTVNRPTAIIPVDNRQPGQQGGASAAPDPAAMAADPRDGRRQAPQPASQRQQNQMPVFMR